MKTITKLTAILSCIAVAGSLAANAAFAAEPTTSDVTIDAIAVACGYTSSQSQTYYDSSTGTIQLGGSYNSSIVGSIDSSKYPVVDGSDSIKYNEKDKTTSLDTNVTYLRFNLENEVKDTDKYTLTMTIGDPGHSSRTGNMNIYAAIADMTAPVVTTNTTSGVNWTTDDGITWATRPAISGVQILVEDLDTTKGNNVTLDLEKVLVGKQGTVTVALLSCPNTTTNTTTMSHYKFNSLALTRTTTATEDPAPEVVWTNATKVSPDAENGVTKDAVGFKCTLSGVTGTVSSLKWKVTHTENGTAEITANTTELTSTDTTTYVVGLLITDITEAVIANLSAQAAIQ